MVNDSKPKTATQRPLSPHIQIYRWQWSMMYSIMHRLTGVALSAGLVVLAIWLVCVAYAVSGFDGAYQCFISVFSTGVGELLLAFFAWGGCYHMLNGIRHLCWDGGIGFELSTARFSGHLIMALSLVGLFLLWFVV